MKKKFLALVLTLAMVLSLVPVTALAAGATPTLDVVDGYYNNDNQWVQGEQARSDELQDTVTTVDKTAKKVEDNQYEVTLKVEMKYKETAVPPGAAATVLVIDTSGSMKYCTKEEHQHTDACYRWEKCTPQNHPDHYYANTEIHKPGTDCTLTIKGYFYKVLTCTKEGHKHSDQTCGTPRRLAVAKDAAKDFLNSYRGGTVRENGTWVPSTNPLKRYISVVWFNKGVSSSEWLDVSTQDGYDKAIRSINDLSAIEGTNLDAGLRMADAQLNNNTVKDMPADVVVLTDGKPTYYLTEATFLPSVEIGSGQYWIMNDGQDCTQNTYDQTVSTAQSLRSSVSGGVYTVCFGASSEILSLVDGKPTVGTFLQEKVATQPEAGSTQKYAYEAQDADDLNRVFAAISSSVVSGLNTGKVTDTLPNGVSCTDGTFGEGRTLTWELKADDATQSPADSNGFITYTYEKTYKVEIDPAAEGLYVVDGYVPLNLPTKLTVKNSDNRDVDIPFPIPAGKVTYSLTDFDKALVTNQNKPDGLTIPNGVTIPANTTDPVVVSGEGVTLLYKITVNGDKGAKFTVRDAGATLVSPDTIADGEDSTFSGTVGTTGTTVFYVSKHFAKSDIDSSSDTQTVSNTATIAPGDNAKGPDDNEKAVITTVTEPEPQTYTVIFNANGGVWSSGVAGYEMQQDTATSTYVAAQKSNLTKEDAFSLLDGTGLSQDGKRFVGWGATRTQSNQYLLSQLSTVGQLVNVMKNASLLTSDNTITLYAIWEDISADQCTYTIHQHFMKDADNEDGAINYYTTSQVASAGTSISSLIPNELINTSTDYNFNGSKYLYEAAKIGTDSYTGQETLQAGNTEIHLYYYLDSLTDADKDGTSTDKDSLTDGDGIPDYKQILIQYQVYQKDNGLVTPEFEVVTVKNGNELTAIHGSSVTKAGTGYTFVTWTGQNATVTEKTVDKIVAESTKLNNKDCNPSGDTFEQGKSYTYTAIFLEDKLGGGDNKDQPDGIPDAWQYKVTFKVVNGKWNNQTTADVVAYVTNKKNDTPCAKGTEGSKATLDGVTIPVAGSQPDSGYRASGNWDTTPSATTVINKEDTVFTYTYDQKSGGSGGSGGSHKPTVTIPDDVPTGLNGKDHYAYVVGYPDGMVYPQKNITRAEVATIFFRLLTDETREANMTKSNSYNDMKDGAWYTCAVSTLSKMGIIKGYEDGSFKPDASISRAEFAAIAARFDPDGDKTPATFSDVSSHWAKDEISIAANHGWIKGYEDGSFKPDQKITRAETMTLVNRVLKRLPETKDDLHKDMKTWPDNQNESAWFYLAVQEATNSHYQKLKKDGIHEKWESMRETRDWAALEK